MAPTGNDVLVCEDCGEECNARDRLEFNGTVPCEEGHGHNWSVAHPLARLKARVKATSGLQVLESEDNETWQWADVQCAGVSESEILSNFMKREGFEFCALGDEANCIRVNRKKEDDQ